MQGTARFCAKEDKLKYDLQTPHLFPNLNKEELFLILRHPVKMLKAYQVAWRQKALFNFFDMNSSNGPGDACRQFCMGGPFV